MNPNPETTHNGRFYGRAHEAAEKLLDAFRAGGLPEVMAYRFLTFDGSPSGKWSMMNQVLMALAGYDDARGFRQWESVGRHVKKGQHGFPIFVPLFKKLKDTDPKTGEEIERRFLYGFGSTIVFGYEQTEGEELPHRADARQFIDTLPVIEVARAWGLEVVPADTRKRGAAGWYIPTKHAIALGAKNYSTWAHELMHASDDRLGNNERKGQFWASEIVAELGGCVLLRCLGYEHEADAGGCWQYLEHYATEAGKDTTAACLHLLDRTCKAVAAVLEAAAHGS